MISNDEVAGFAVLDVPGHSAGHVAFWRESDRVLILGDVLANMDQYTGIPGLHEPKPALTPDPARNRESPSPSRPASSRRGMPGVVRCWPSSIRNSARRCWR